MRYAGVLLAALLAASCFAAQASAGDSASVTVVPDSISVVPNETLSVDLLIDPPAATTAAWVLEVDYEPGALQYVSCHALDPLSGPTLEASDCHDSGHDRVSVLGSSLTVHGKRGIDTPTRVATITFTAIGAQGTRTPLTVSVKIMADPDGNPEPTDTHDGSVSITAPVPGDTDCDGDADSTDALNILAYLGGVGETTACWDNADANHDGNVDVRDAFAILDHEAGIA